MKKLTGLSILVTRPAPQGELLCDKIREENGNAIYFPTLAIAPIALQQEALKNIAQMNWLIFVSPQAVYHSLRYLDDLPSQIKIAAVGGGTAKALQDAGKSVQCYPADDWSSEGLLDLPDFQSIREEKIAIVKGEGGRDTLLTTLLARGAEVAQMVVYQRIMPSLDVEPVLALLQAKKIDRIICASVEGLRNLKILLVAQWFSLQKIYLLVVSERMRTAALKMGFTHVVVAKNANYSSLIDSLSKEKNT